MSHRFKINSRYAVRLASGGMEKQCFHSGMPAPFALPGVLAFRGADSKRLMCRWRGAAVSAAGSAPVS